MPESSMVAIKELPQMDRTITGNLMNTAEPLFRVTGKVTHESKTATGFERPIGNRATRADLLHQAQFMKEAMNVEAMSTAQDVLRKMGTTHMTNEEIQRAINAVRAEVSRIQRPVQERDETKLSEYQQKVASLITSDHLNSLLHQSGALKELFSEARQRDEISQQFARQNEVAVTMGELGKQTARLVDLTPPHGKDLHLPPIFFITGISGPPESSKTLAEELAFSGRHVIMVGHPESPTGHVTPEFVKAVQDHTDYQDHLAFFKPILQTYVDKYDKVELWGHSEGGALTGFLLQDKQIEPHITNAVLLSPASSDTISQAKLNMGVAKETFYLATHDHFPKYMYTTGKDAQAKELAPGSKRKMHEEKKRKMSLFERTKSMVKKLVEKKKPLTPEEQDALEQQKLKGQVFKEMLKKVTTQMDYLQPIPEKAGRKVVVINASHDFLTNSMTIYEEGENRDHIDEFNISTVPGSHNVFMTEATKMVKYIEDVQKGKNVQGY